MYCDECGDMVCLDASDMLIFVDSCSGGDKDYGVNRCVLLLTEVVVVIDRYIGVGR